jgi:hypothetical protein
MLESCVLITSCTIRRVGVAPASSSLRHSRTAIQGGAVSPAGLSSSVRDQGKERCVSTTWGRESA